MPPNPKSDSELLEVLLQFDLQSFASELGFASRPEPLPTSAAVALLNLAERCSRKADDESRRICLAICGLLTEYRREDWVAAPGFIVNLLSRIGLAPSMRMADPSYRRDDDTFSSLGSFATEIAVVSRCMRSEVMAAGQRRLLLSEFQFRVWNLIEEHARIGISAPTSAGKSHVLVHKVLDALWKAPGIAVFVVPTISLIQQVTRDIRDSAWDLQMRDVGVYQSYLEGVSARHASTVFVLTQERALSAFSQPQALTRSRIVVIDEVQNIERVSEQDDERAHTLLEVIHEFEQGRKAEKIVISGPRVENIGQLTKDLFGPLAVTATAGLPPVVNLTYTFSKQGAKRNVKTVLKQYTEVSSKPRVIELVGAENIRKEIFSKQQYTDASHEIIGHLTEKLSVGHGTLIFSPTSDQATDTATELAKRIELSVGDQVSSLSQYVAETVHDEYALVRTLPKGIAFHHGKMPQHVRSAVEYAFARQYVTAIVCTTTLMQGINLPAKNLIARNANLFLRGGQNAHTLTPYEFANLRGRAGRLMKDFVGRSLILDESMFPDGDEYVRSPGTKVSSGYGIRFEESRGDIMEQLVKAERPIAGRIGGDIVTYVRHSIYRFRDSALARLQQAGITLSDEEYAGVLATLDRLKVPPAVVERNPGWDPLDLEALHDAYLRRRLVSVPRSPFAQGFVDAVGNVVQSIEEVAPLYVRRYLGDISNRYIRRVAITAQNWSMEKPLKEIIGWWPTAGVLDSKTIDDRLATLLNAVVYNLPKLLRPVVMMQDLDNPLLGFIELGAFRPDSRRLIELGLGRETAIRCTSRFVATLGDAVSDESLLAAAVRAAEALTPWDRLSVNEISTGKSLLELPS
jgi:hypothetical protein